VAGESSPVGFACEEERMIVARFKVQCKPDKTEEVLAAMKEVVLPSRDLPGVLNFDIGRDITDPDALIATEVYADRAAMEKQESQPEVAAVLHLLEAGAANAPLEWTVYEIASAESPLL
jgi:quinol monooxygenase YgiN